MIKRTIGPVLLDGHLDLLDDEINILTC
jgi:hypothetical protein